MAANAFSPCRTKTNGVTWLVVAIALLPVALFPSRTAGARGELPSGNAVIRGKAGRSEIVITTTKRVAGAIHSLTWGGREFIDSFDHGRQLQSASNFDAGTPFAPETFNPTEAGSLADGRGETSTSRLLHTVTTPNGLQTTTRMAFWLKPGERSSGNSAKNTTPLSDHLLTKRVRIGQLNTGARHWLDAAEVSDALDELDLASLDLLLIENVSALIGPTEFDLGEYKRVGMFSVATGDDKLVKYSDVVRWADVVVLNKTDLLASLPFSLERFRDQVRRVNPHAALFEMSTLSGDGLEPWLSWLRWQSHHAGRGSGARAERYRALE